MKATNEVLGDLNCKRYNVTSKIWELYRNKKLPQDVIRFLSDTKVSPIDIFLTIHCTYQNQRP
jgi:hypothetical protein